MPDDQGNLMPGDEGYVAPEQTNENVETPPAEITEETPPDPAEEVTDVDSVEEVTPSEQTQVVEKPGHQNSTGFPFYQGSPVVNPDNALLTFGETDLNKENR